MRLFKPGDRVVCIADNSYGFIKGKIYDVYKYHGYTGDISDEHAATVRSSEGEKVANHDLVKLYLKLLEPKNHLPGWF